MTDTFKDIRPGDKLRVSFETTVDDVIRASDIDDSRHDGEGDPPRQDALVLHDAPAALHFGYLHGEDVTSGRFAVAAAPQPDADGAVTIPASHLCGDHIGMLIANTWGAETYDAEFGGIFDQRNRVFHRVSPAWLPILMVTHKKNGATRVRTKISEAGFGRGETVRVRPRERQ